jgi:hypothetical protein
MRQLSYRPAGSSAAHTDAVAPPPSRRDAAVFATAGPTAPRMSAARERWRAEERPEAAKDGSELIIAQWFSAISRAARRIEL